MVALKQPFRCPSCGGPLTPPNPALMRRSLVKPLLAGGGALIILLLAIIWLTSPRPKTEAVTHAAAPEAAPVQAAALVPAGPPPTVAADQLGSSPPSATVVGSSGPAGPTSATLALSQAGQPVAPTPDVQPPAPTPPAPEQAEAPAAAAPKPSAKAAAPKHEHRVVAARAKPRAPGEISAEMLPTDGSRPEYPTEYEDDGEQGSVAVTCIIMPDGHATGCRVSRRTGGPRFAVAVQRWLDRDATRFPPMVRNGHPVPARFTWNIQFFP